MKKKFGLQHRRGKPSGFVLPDGKIVKLITL